MRSVSTLGCIATIASLPFVAGAADNGNVPRGPKRDFVGVFFVQAAGAPTEDPIRCPDPRYPSRIDFSGIAYTNLGRATFAQSHCEGPDNALARYGEEVITFVDGREILYSTYEASVIVTPTTVGPDGDSRVIIDGTYRNTGGTGSLEDAHGRGISAGAFNIRTGTGQIAISGTL